MGRHSYGRPQVRWYYGDDARVRIGHFTAIADDVVLSIGGSHPTGWVSTFPFRSRFRQPGAYRDGLPEAERDIVIGNDVWIGRGARILAGVQDEASVSGGFVGAVSQFGRSLGTLGALAAAGLVLVGVALVATGVRRRGRSTRRCR